MLPQIANITKYYDEWAHKPVDRPLRLFEPWYLEMCTKTPWWVVPTFWIPVIIGIASMDMLAKAENSNDVSRNIFMFIKHNNNLNSFSIIRSQDSHLALFLG